MYVATHDRVCFFARTAGTRPPIFLAQHFENRQVRARLVFFGMLLLQEMCHPYEAVLAKINILIVTCCFWLLAVDSFEQPLDWRNALFLHLAKDIAFECGFEDRSLSGDGWFVELWRLSKINWDTVGIGDEGKRSRWWSLETRGEVFKQVRALTLMVRSSLVVSM